MRAPATLDQMKIARSPELGRSPFWERSSRALPDPETAPASETSRPARAAAVKSPTGSAESGRGSEASSPCGGPGARRPHFYFAAFPVRVLDRPWSSTIVDGTSCA
jgi:hypothetical protein